LHQVQNKGHKLLFACATTDFYNVAKSATALASNANSNTQLLLLQIHHDCSQQSTARPAAAGVQSRNSN
jgi:hypothetical protein